MTVVGLKGSYLGFTFNGIHSSKLGITRTFNENLFSINLVPTLKDKVVDQVQDGQFYFGTDYNKREFEVSFAFEGLTEEQLIKIKKIFNDKKIHDLIFDEDPYKVWSAKLTGVSTHKQLCFCENDVRLYRGEGTYVFLCAFPYARSRYQFQEDYVVENITEWLDENAGYLFKEGIKDVIYPSELEYFLNLESGQIYGALHGEYNKFAEWVDQVNQLEHGLPLDDANSQVVLYNNQSVYINYWEWIAASGLPSREDFKYQNGYYSINNVGDFDIPFRVMYLLSDITDDLVLSIDELHQLEIRNLVDQSNDVYICIDSRKGIIQGYDQNRQPTKNYYNKYITRGQLFDMPVGKVKLYSNIKAVELEYHYLYL